MKLAATLLLAVTAVIIGYACINKDPYARLPNGYELAAVSPGSELNLMYSRAKDPRNYSDWRSYANTDSESQAQDQGAPQFLVTNTSTGEILTYPTRYEWEDACKQKRAAPVMRNPIVEDVRGFGGAAQIVYGTTAGCFFILDTDANRLEKFDNESAWCAAVARRTGMPPHLTHRRKK